MSPKPSDLLLCMPFLPSTFKKAEIEFAAVIVILWHLDQKLEDWTPVSPKTVVRWALETKSQPMAQLRENPFYLPNFQGLQEGGFIDGWKTSEDVGVFSELGMKKLAELIERQN